MTWTVYPVTSDKDKGYTFGAPLVFSSRAQAAKARAQMPRTIGSARIMYALYDGFGSFVNVSNR